jgi:ClpP class serine protease
MEDVCVLGLLEPTSSIDSTDLDQIFTGLSQLNRDRSKDVVLLLLTRGGAIEPAYQISKLCKSFAAKRFIAVVPRFAKSAATPIASVPTRYIWGH